MNPLDTETIELLSAAASPRPLFVLLHDEGGTAADMLALGDLLGDAFAESAVLIPEGLAGPRADAARVEALAAFVRAAAAF
ncbi:hypothetical protein LP417_15685 [Polaromonas sp. P1-6]|nr:hypothetical protein LP417_15685 [Polaromonas sp. P1-6]